VSPDELPCKLALVRRLGPSRRKSRAVGDLLGDKDALVVALPRDHGAEEDWFVAVRVERDLTPSAGAESQWMAVWA
jgi:hypothetical protein